MTERDTSKGIQWDSDCDYSYAAGGSTNEKRRKYRNTPYKHRNHSRESNQTGESTSLSYQKAKSFATAQFMKLKQNNKVILKSKIPVKKVNTVDMCRKLS